MRCLTISITVEKIGARLNADSCFPITFRDGLFRSFLCTQVDLSVVCNLASGIFASSKLKRQEQVDEICQR
jgi:hypothetical protein